MDLFTINPQIEEIPFIDITEMSHQDLAALLGVPAECLIEWKEDIPTPSIW